MRGHGGTNLLLETEYMLECAEFGSKTEFCAAAQRLSALVETLVETETTA